MSSAEFTGWIKYAEHEPFGYPMDNYRMAVPAAALYNAVLATVPIPRGKRRPKPMQPSDLYPEQKKREPELTPEQKEYVRKKRARRK